MELINTSFCQVGNEQSKFIYRREDYEEVCDICPPHCIPNETPYGTPGCPVECTCPSHCDPTSTPYGTPGCPEVCTLPPAPEICSCNPLSDEVRLSGRCPAPDEEAIRLYSTIRQQTTGARRGIDVILERVEECQQGLLTASRNQDYNTVNTITECIDTVTRNNRDDVYLVGNNMDIFTPHERYLIDGNPFCRLFTDEDTTINYPGKVINASARQSFTFREAAQPSIEASIDAHFFFNINHWRIEYDHALRREAEAFTRWQEAAAIENAITRLNSAYPTCTQTLSNCGCDDSWCDEDNPCDPCPPPSLVNAGSSHTERNLSNTHFRANGTEIIEYATRSCTYCSGSTVTPLPNPRASTLEIEFRNAQAARERLEAQYNHCAELVDITNTEADDPWEWLHDPQLRMVYENMFYDAHLQAGSLLDRIRVESVPVDFVPICPPIANRPEGWVCPEEWIDWEEMSPVTQYLWPAGTNTGDGLHWRPAERQRYNCTRNVNSDTLRFERIRNIPENSKTSGYNVGTFRELTAFDNAYTNCYVSYTETRYFMTDNRWYALVPGGMFLTEDIVEEETFNLPNIAMDYVMNIRRTVYRGIYDYWFVVDNIGHHKGPDWENYEDTNLLDKEPFPDLAHRSNIQHSVDRCVNNMSLPGCGWARGGEPGPDGVRVNPLVNTTSYAFRNLLPEINNVTGAREAGELFEERLTPRFHAHQCTMVVRSPYNTSAQEPCIPGDPSTFHRPYFNRPIPLNEGIRPANRELSENWRNGKGEAALDVIINRNNGDDIFGQTPEYSFVIGPTTTAWIRNENRNRRHAGGFNDFDLECNDYGKECISRFITELYAHLGGLGGNRSSLVGRNYWRYFVNTPDGGGEFRPFRSPTPGNPRNPAFSYPRLLNVGTESFDACPTGSCYWP